MTEGKADSTAPATGDIALREWIDRHANSLGRDYANELHRHFRPGAGR
jgi:hypothetical protein